MCCTNGIPETALGFRAKPTAWRDAGNFRPRDAGGSGPKWLLCMFAARKCPDARDDVVPVQSLYSRDPMRAPPTLRWFGPLTMRDGLRTSETEHDESLLGPFQPDDGLAWHASVPPNFPDGDTDNAARLLCCSKTIRCLVPRIPVHDTIRHRGRGAYRTGTDASFFRRSMARTRTPTAEPSLCEFRGSSSLQHPRFAFQSGDLSQTMLKACDSH